MRTLPTFIAALLITGLVPDALANAAQQGRGRVQVEAEDGTSAISGVVTDYTGGRPIAGAVVTLTGGGLRPVGRGSAAPQQVTDGNGRFVFVGLQAGVAYSLLAAKSGYLRPTLNEPTRGAARIILAPGEWHRDADIMLRRPAVIAGTVVDELGEPMVGIFVRLLPQLLVAGVEHAVSGPTTKTDDRGMYRFAGLLPASYRVVVPSVQSAVPAATPAADLLPFSPARTSLAAASGAEVPAALGPSLATDAGSRLFIGPYPVPPPRGAGRPQSYPITYYPSARTRDAAATIVVDYGDERNGIDIRLTPVPTASVSGRVEGPVGAVAALTLRLMPSDSESLTSGSEAATALVATDSTFAFVHVPAGDYVIVASHSQTQYRIIQDFADFNDMPPEPPGMRLLSTMASAAFSAPTGTMLETKSGAGDSAHFGRLPVEVGDTDVANLVVRLTTGGAVRGRIDVEGDVANRRIRSVAAEPANGAAELGMLNGGVDPNDPQRRFEIEGLRPGGYLLRLFGAGGFLIKSITWNGRDYNGVPFDASNGQTYDDVVVLVTTRSAAVSGSVRDARGLPSDHAAVICFPEEPARWRRYGLQPDRLKAVAAAPDGTFRLTGLPAGSYRLIAVDAERIEAWKDPAFLERAASLATRVTLDWDGTVTQSLTLQQVPNR